MPTEFAKIFKLNNTKLWQGCKAIEILIPAMGK